MKIFGLRGILLAGLVGLGALGTVGCGSDSKDTGTGGTTGGGTGGGAGGAVTHKINYTFTSGDEGWKVNDYCGTDGNLGGKPAADAAVTCLQPAMPPSTAFDSTDGSPSPGSLKVTVTYTGYQQYVDAIVGPPAGTDLTGRTLHAKIKLVSSTGGDFPGGAQMHVSTGPTYVYGNAPGGAVALGTWADLSFPLSIISATTTPGWDPAMIMQIGIQFYSGDAVAGGTLSATAPITAVFAIDTVTD